MTAAAPASFTRTATSRRNNLSNGGVEEERSWDTEEDHRLTTLVKVPQEQPRFSCNNDAISLAELVEGVEGHP